MMYTGIRIP